MNPIFGIAIVHFGDPEATERCLESIDRDASTVGRRVVVVDNSGDFPEELLHPGVERLDSADNPGFGEGANRGLRHLLECAAPRWLLVLNHDVELDSGFLDGARDALERTDVGKCGVGAAAGPIYSSPDGKLWYAGGSVAYLAGTVRQSRSARDASRPRQVGFLPGTAIAVRNEAFRQVGGFDPRIFLYNEDLDLCRRLSAKGFGLYFQPSMSCRHRLGQATGSAQRSPLYLEHLTAGRFLPFSNRWYRAYLGVLHSPYVLLRCLAALHHGKEGGRARAAALLRGHWRALKTIFSS